MAYRWVAVDRPAEGVGRIALNRPEKLNALSRELLADLRAALDELGRDESLICVIVTGRGRAFSAGVDLNVLGGLGTALDMRGFITELHDTLRQIEFLPQPVIAAVNGVAFGGSAELVASCDFAIAGRSAKFGMPEPNIGLPSVIQAALFPRYASLGRVREWLYTAKVIDAVEAERWGFFNRVVPDDQLEADVLATAAEIVSKGAQASRLQKELINTMWLRSDLDSSMRDSIKVAALAYSTGEPQSRARAIQAEIAARKSQRPQ